MPETQTILPDTEMLKLLYVCASGQRITLVARTTSAEVCCPVCGMLSRRVHSRHVRTLADLPWQGIPVSIRLHVRRFFCKADSCERAIFTERLPGVVAHYARRTERLDGLFTHVSFALGGEAGARLLGELGVVVSGDTLLAHIRSLNLGESRTPRILSVDDFSFRRGRSWGTILVDLEHHRLVDILPDRSSETFARWLAQQAEMEVVSRDRGGEYANAARKAAPCAIQVMLRRLRDWQRSHMLESGMWRTAISPRELGTLVGSSPVQATQLLAQLINEGYVRGEFWKDPERYFRSSRSAAEVSDPIARFVSLTDKGLRAIGELPELDDSTRFQEPRRPQDGTPAQVAQSGREPEPGGESESRGETEEEKEAASEGTTAFVQTLFAFVTLMIALSFPIGVITLSLQLASVHDYGLWTPLYAAAVTAKTIVVGKVIPVLLYSLVILLPVLGWYLNKRTRWTKPDPSDSEEQNPVGGAGPWTRLLKAVIWMAFLTPILVIGLIVGLWSRGRIGFHPSLVLIILAFASAGVALIGGLCSVVLHEVQVILAAASGEA